MLPPLTTLWTAAFTDIITNYIFHLIEYCHLKLYSHLHMQQSEPMLIRIEWRHGSAWYLYLWFVLPPDVSSALKLVHLFSINPHLGPLQVSLGRMVIDIVKFFFVYTLVLFAFACGKCAYQYCYPVKVKFSGAKWRWCRHAPTIRKIQQESY